ncbi:MAG: hypothetical protein RSG50_05005 [Clostridia bacterium]
MAAIYEATAAELRDKIAEREMLAACAESAGDTRTALVHVHVKMLYEAQLRNIGGRLAQTEGNNILSGEYERLIVEDVRAGKELAVITDDAVTTASDRIVVRLKPRDTQCSVSTGGHGSLP